LGLSASFVAFLLACLAASLTYAAGYSVLVVVLVYSGVGAISLVLIVLIADWVRRAALRSEAMHSPEAVAPPARRASSMARPASDT